MQSRMPLESREPIVAFSLVRILLTVVALAAVLIFSVPHTAELAILIGAIALPWSLLLYFTSRRSAAASMGLWVPAVDILLLAAAELIEPKTYAGVRFFALFLIAAHAQLQGEERGFLIAVLSVAVLVPIGVLQPHPIAGDLIGFYESLFAISAIAGGILIGRLRTSESTGRLRARELSRRAIEAENEVRRRLAETIHDGPVQELVSLDMMLTAAKSSIERGESERALESMDEAQSIAERNIRSLRDEIVGLGPYAFEELTFQSAIDQCVPIWRKRFDMDIDLDLAEMDMESEVCGSLFGIAQESVANAARHGNAGRVSITLTREDGAAVMRVSDDGTGFRGVAPLGARELGHIGLASMRERAELIGGELKIDSADGGTEVRVTIPLTDGKPPRPRSRFRGARDAKAISD